jgi:seryl-tRNA synthetase
MLDIQLLRNNLDAIAERLATRGFTLDRSTFQQLENERKFLQTRTQELQAGRNSLSRQVGMLKGRGEDAAAVMEQVAAIKNELEANAVRLASCSRNSMRFWRCFRICRKTAFRWADRTSTTSR